LLAKTRLEQYGLSNNGEVSRGIRAAIDEIENHPSLWVGILASTTPRASAKARACLAGTINGPLVRH
jgi:hypothetical protein